MQLENNELEDEFVMNEVIGDEHYKNSSENTKRRTVVGPWKNVEEFNKVYEWLFGEQNTQETRQKALSQIRVWNLRRSNLCPAAVLATSVIIEVQLKDCPETKFNSEELQILYANAFTRFFNFMSSIMQSHNMRTMYQTATELGLQSFVVDLRHICAHGQVLPPLQVLRNTAEYCIVWLHDYYWTTQRHTMSDVDAAHIRRKDKTQFDENVSDLFEIYDAALEGHMKGATNIKTLKRHLHGKRFHRLKEFYMQNKLTDLESTFDAIVEQLCKLVKRDASVKDMTEIYVEAFLKMSFFFNLTENYTIDKQLISLMSVIQALFRMMAIYGFIEDLFLALIEIAENPIAAISRRKAASFWAVEIAKGFQAFQKCRKMYKSELDADSIIDASTLPNGKLTKTSKRTRKLYLKSGIDIKRTLVIGDHFRRPWVWTFEHNFIRDRLEVANEYTAPILKSILPLIQPELNNNDMQTFTSLIDCMFTTNADEEEAKDEISSNKIHTVQDLLQKLNKQDKLEAMAVDNENECDSDQNDDEVLNKEDKYGLWSLMPDDETHNWKTCPLGRLPWE